MKEPCGLLRKQDSVKQKSNINTTMKKYIFTAISAIMIATCANKRADEITKVAESSKLKE